MNVSKLLLFLQGFFQLSPLLRSCPFPPASSVSPTTSASLHHHTSFTWHSLAEPLTCSSLTFVPELFEGGRLTRVMYLAQGWVQRGAQKTSGKNGWINDWWKAEAGRWYVMIQNLQTQRPGCLKTTIPEVGHSWHKIGARLLVMWTI